MEENKKKDLVIPGNMMQGIQGYKTDYVALRMEKMSDAMIKQFRKKDADYDGSWQKDGLLSVHYNFKRKVDRVIAQFENGTIVGGSGENIGDTLIDLATYSLMYVHFLECKDSVVSDFVINFIEKLSRDGGDSK